MRRLFLLLAFLFAPISLTAGPIIGIAYPPAGDDAARAFTVAALADLGVRHVRIGETWARRPLHATPEDFAPLVRRIGALRAGGLRVLLTVSSDGPDAACLRRSDHACAIAPDAPFEAFVESLLTAVGDDLDAIQFANEWDNRFPGSSAEFLTLHARFATTVRRLRPDLTLVLGGVTGRAPYSVAICEAGIAPDLGPEVETAGITKELCSRDAARNRTARDMVSAALAQADYDVADLHLYDAVNAWPFAVDWIRARSAGRPVWLTEFGGPNPEVEPASPEYQASRLALYLDMVARLPVARAYYFKLTDDPGSYHSRSGLYDRQGRPKPSLAVFRAALK
jgi:hypothetical protein